MVRGGRRGRGELGERCVGRIDVQRNRQRSAPGVASSPFRAMTAFNGTQIVAGFHYFLPPNQPPSHEPLDAGGLAVGRTPPSDLKISVRMSWAGSPRG